MGGLGRLMGLLPPIDWDRVARAAISAMRQPTEEMEFAAIPAEIEARLKFYGVKIGDDFSHEYQPLRCAIRAAFTAMIDEALSRRKYDKR